MKELAAIYYACLSLLHFIAMGFDKRKAIKGKYRIPERTLFIFALLGGGVGGLLGMLLFRHKIRKAVFWAVYIITTAAHGALMFWLFYVR